MRDPTDYSKQWKIKFTCPFCGTNSYVYGREWCPITNIVKAFELTDWTEKSNSELDQALDSEIEWDRPIIEFGDENITYHCGNCHDELSSEINDGADLFNWLHERGFVEQS